jgi:hypothetical protein
MAPDFPYFIQPGVYPQFVHTPLPALVFGAPASLLVLALFRTVLLPPTLALLPPAHQPPLKTIAGRFTATVWLVCLGLAVGALTHVFWDGFTHHHGWAVERFPALSSLAKPLQHGCGILGLLALGVWYGHAVRTTVASEGALPDVTFSPRERLMFWGGALLLGAVAGCLIGRDQPTLERFATKGTVGGIDAMLLWWTLWALLWYYRHRWNRANRVL